MAFANDLGCLGIQLFSERVVGHRGADGALALEDGTGQSLEDGPSDDTVAAPDYEHPPYDFVVSKTETVPKVDEVGHRA